MPVEEMQDTCGRGSYAAREWLRGYCQIDNALADMMIEFALAPREEMIIRFVAWQLNRCLIISPPRCDEQVKGRRNQVEHLLAQLEIGSRDFAQAFLPFKNSALLEHLISLLTLLSEQGILHDPWH